MSFASTFAPTLALVLLAGCATSKVAPRQTLTSTDFSSAPASTAVAIKAPPAAGVKTTPTASAKPVPLATTRTEALDVIATPGPPTLSKEEPKAVKDSVLVDATVGEVNGKPVTVSGLLEPLGARLRAISQDKSVTRTEWRKTAVWAIGTSIKGMVEDELLRAEAMASFSPEQRQGFLAFIEDMTRKFRSENLGAIEVANKRLQENEGRTIDEWRRDTEIKELVSFQLYKKAYGQVQVSKRDTEVYYENNIDEYRPHAKAHFRRISVKATDTQAVDEVTRRLAAGEPFAAVASGPFNSLAGSEAGLYVIELKGDRATAEFWRSKEINKAAQTMEPGTVVGPLEIEGSPATKQWLFLETIDQPKGLEWYDAQLPIERELRVRRGNELKERYLARLKERASFTAPEDMLKRLLVIADERYYNHLWYDPSSATPTTPTAPTSAAPTTNPATATVGPAVAADQPKP